jgi:hypothetical protein
MIEVFIKSVSVFAEYEDRVYSYKVIGVLDNGLEITFIDEIPIDLTRYIHKKINIIFVSKNNSFGQCFIGKIRQKGDIYYFENSFIKINLPIDIIEEKNITINKIEKYYFDELILKKII